MQLRLEPERLFESLRDDLDPSIAAISTLMIAITTSIFVIAQINQRKR